MAQSFVVAPLLFTRTQAPTIVTHWIRYFIRLSVLYPGSWSNAVSKTVGLSLQKTNVSMKKENLFNFYFAGVFIILEFCGHKKTN